MADVERRRCMAQEMITGLWNRMTICWLTDCKRELSPKNYGTRHRSNCWHKRRNTNTSTGGKDTKIHLLSGIVKCPVCGVGMYGNKSIKHKADGSKYKDFYYYGCKHRAMTRGHKCDFKKQINEELLDSAVAEVIVKAGKQSEVRCHGAGKNSA